MVVKNEPAGVLEPNIVLVIGNSPLFTRIPMAKSTEKEVSTLSWSDGLDLWVCPQYRRRVPRE